jgi:hypothetical protein
MKLWKTAIMAMTLGLSANNAAADANLFHVSPKLALAQPCANSGCAFTWTLATRYGVALQFAEQRYGQRDLNWTLLGVDFAQLNAPQIFYAGIYDGRKDIVIQLTANAARDEKRALFQLAHEVIHTLSPIGPDARSSVLEEGIATYNSLDYVRYAGFKISPTYINAENYSDAYWTIVELEAKQPDFQARTAALRKRYGSLSGLTAVQIQSAYPSIDPTLASRLARNF